MVEEAGERIREAVESHMISDVPVGAYLSGGMDSSLVVAMMSEICGARRADPDLRRRRRRPQVQRAALRADGRRALRHPASRGDGLARHGRAPAVHGPPPRRALGPDRRLHVSRGLPGLQARQGGAHRRRRRRDLRRLRPLLRLPLGEPLRRAARGGPALSAGAGGLRHARQLRPTRTSPRRRAGCTTSRSTRGGGATPRRPPSSASARRARGALRARRRRPPGGDRSHGVGDPRLRRGRGAQRPRPHAPGRHLDPAARALADALRPHDHGAQPGGPLPLPRPPAGRVRGDPAGELQDAGEDPQVSAAPGGRPLPAGDDPQAPEAGVHVPARLLDEGPAPAGAAAPAGDLDADRGGDLPPRADRRAWSRSTSPTAPTTTCGSG